MFKMHALNAFLYYLIGIRFLISRRKDMNYFLDKKENAEKIHK